MDERSSICSALISKSATRYLSPLGLKRKGRSRTWLGDQSWWFSVVEFQQSGFSVGTSLNVSCMWLWTVKNHISFDEGSHSEVVSPFENEVQFAPVAARLALRAAELATKYQRLFDTVQGTSDFYLMNLPVAGWPSFNAAISHGLAGRVQQSRKLFDTWGSGADDNREWVQAARADSKELMALVEDRSRFHSVIASRVNRTRQLHKLAPLPRIDFGLPS